MDSDCDLHNRHDTKREALRFMLCALDRRRDNVDGIRYSSAILLANVAGSTRPDPRDMGIRRKLLEVKK